MAQDQMSRLAEEVAKKLNQMGQGSLQGMGSTSAPAGGIAPTASVSPAGAASPAGGIGREIQAGSGIAGTRLQGIPEMKDRGIYHASDAMRDMYDMGDAPSCGVCGAIMVRNGSCYRCMSCGSTSGCS
jgi:ribonucleoside-diphosphate reductase alpha chain